MFSHFSLPDIATVSRRTVIGGLIIGVVGLIVAVVIGDGLAGLGIAIGIGLGTLNFRMVQSSVAKVGEREDENRRRPLAMNTIGRLGLLSAVTLGLLFVSFQLGFGVLAGLGAFEALLLVNVARSMLAMGGGLSGGGLSGGIVGVTHPDAEESAGGSEKESA